MQPCIIIRMYLKLTGLESETTYSITVTLSNAVESTTSTPMYKIHCIIFIPATVTPGSEGDNTAVVIAAIVGGLLGTLLILSVTVIMIVTVTCLLRNHRRNDTCKKYVYLVYFV